MRQAVITIFLMLAAISTPLAQHDDLAMRLAEQLGLCSSQKKKPGEFNLDYPCDQCEITFTPLSAGAPPGQMFLLEVQSPNHCGSGGCTGTVYRKYGNTYQEAQHFFGFFEKTIARPGSATPDIIYAHIEYPRYDYDYNGSNDHAIIRAQYQWDVGKAAYELADILSIQVNGKKIPLAPWRKLLLQEYRQASPWVY